MPKGNWLWPAIWMMPESNKADGAGIYGQWPRSGEYGSELYPFLPNGLP
jgi:beta-glucanase (GH16 family)